MIGVLAVVAMFSYMFSLLPINASILLSILGLCGLISRLLLFWFLCKFQNKDAVKPYKTLVSVVLVMDAGVIIVDFLPFKIVRFL